MSWEPNRLESQRLEKLEQLKNAGINPFPLRINRTHTNQVAIDAFSAQEGDENAEPITAPLCGRVVSARDMGKTVFIHIEDEYARIQLFARRQEVGRREAP